MPRIEDNEAEFFADLDKQAPKRRRHFLVIRNVMEYAIFLERKDGYFIFNDQHLIKTADKWIKLLLDSGQALTDDNLARALEAAGFEERTWLRSYTSQRRPPARAGQGTRAAHPGGWADITANLKAAFQFQVNGKGGWHVDQRVNRRQER